MPSPKDIFSRSSATSRGRDLVISCKTTVRPPEPEPFCPGDHLAIGPQNLITSGNGGSRRPTKLLLNVTVQRSLGAVHIVMLQENTVLDLIKAVFEVYVKEKRRPFLTETDPRCLELHYSQFSLESLKPEEKLINLGARNFFLCPKPRKPATSSLCADEAKREVNSLFSLTILMDFLL